MENYMAGESKIISDSMNTCPEPILFPGVLPTAPGEGGRRGGGCWEKT